MLPSGVALKGITTKADLRSLDAVWAAVDREGHRLSREEYGMGRD
eukprot:gene44468-44465_t